jgi:aryl-alcohol dehydrogenase-like predicted oxidoreductase
LGVSAYELDPVIPLLSRLPIAVIQVPGNAFDQRAARGASALLPKPVVHLRSAYLQGLLLLSMEQAISTIPNAAPALAKWHRWLERYDMTPIQGALSVVKSFDAVTACLVGVENSSQLQELMDTWMVVQAVRADELACNDLDLIDPRRWNGRVSNR